MRHLVATAIALAALAVPASAQTYVPITLDQAKADKLMAAIEEISMPQKTYRQIVGLLQDLERQAQADKASADALAKPAPPPTAE